MLEVEPGRASPNTMTGGQCPSRSGDEEERPGFQVAHSRDEFAFAMCPVVMRNITKAPKEAFVTRNLRIPSDPKSNLLLA